MGAVAEGVWCVQGTFVRHRPAECVNGLCAPRVALVRNRSASRLLRGMRLEFVFGSYSGLECTAQGCAHMQ